MTDQERATDVPSETAVVDTTSADLEPWEHPDAIRRDIEPHRGDLLLLMGTLSLILSLLIVTAPLAMLLGGYAWKMAAEDRKKINIGRLDAEGQRPAEMGQALGTSGVILSLVIPGAVLGPYFWLEYLMK
jgi:hypothetical protein